MEKSKQMQTIKCYLIQKEIDSASNKSTKTLKSTFLASLHEVLSMPQFYTLSDNEALLKVRSKHETQAESVSTTFPLTAEI